MSQESYFEKDPKKQGDIDQTNVDMGGAKSDNAEILRINFERHQYPFCIVWTPIPVLTWFLPFVGHMGMAYSNGTIRDFAGPYYVSEDNMAFGWPTRYWQLNPEKVIGGKQAWDRSLYEASELYKTKMHYLCFDNCHSHCARALNLMSYRGSKSWNMIWLALGMFILGKYVGISGFVKSWLPFLLLVSIIVGIPYLLEAQ